MYDVDMTTKAEGPMQPRAVRFDDPTWFELIEAANAEGENLSAVLRRAGRGYIKRHKAKIKKSDKDVTE